MKNQQISISLLNTLKEMLITKEEENFAVMGRINEAKNQYHSLGRQRKILEIQ